MDGYGNPPKGATATMRGINASRDGETSDRLAPAAVPNRDNPAAGRGGSVHAGRDGGRVVLRNVGVRRHHNPASRGASPPVRRPRHQSRGGAAMFRVSQRSEGIDDADTIEGAREIVRGQPPGWYIDTGDPFGQAVCSAAPKPRRESQRARRSGDAGAPGQERLWSFALTKVLSHPDDGWTPRVGQRRTHRCGRFVPGRHQAKWRASCPRSFKPASCRQAILALGRGHRARGFQFREPAPTAARKPPERLDQPSRPATAPSQRPRRPPA
jgi:hypothetical protein